MLKLYRKQGDGPLAYHEAWAEDGNVVEHCGVIGTKGETKKHSLKSRPADTVIEEVLDVARQSGFEEIDFEDHSTLLVEFRVEDMGTPADTAKRHELEDRLNELLGWTGLGECDGGSIGSGTMEACCFVVDFDVAKAVIEADLKDSPFADYQRIYDENVD
jgi:hypothetical protein